MAAINELSSYCKSLISLPLNSVISCADFFVNIIIIF